MSERVTPPAEPTGLRILEFIAENIKRLEVVEIRPEGDVVEITGKNGAGKTSVLDAIWWALSGARNIQSEPIRKGQTEAYAHLDLGEMTVRRTLSRKENGISTTLSVRNREGFEARAPQALIDSFFNSLSMDPLEFIRMDSKAQFEQLRAFVSDVDFDQIEEENKRDREARRELNAEAKRAQAMVDRFTSPGDDDLPTEPIDISAMEGQLEAAGKHNGSIDLRRARRETLLEQAVTLRKDADAELARAHELARQASAIATAAEAKKLEAGELEERVNTAEPLPEPIDTAALRAEINSARAMNTRIEVRKARDDDAEHVARCHKHSADLTAAIEKRLREANDKIAAAQLPVPGLTITPEGTVRLGDVPFDQASDAQQLRASIELAMALNPRLRVIRVRDGSLLDDDGMTLVRGVARERGYQVWIERVASDNPSGFELVDGRLKEKVTIDEVTS